jgi:4-hydroxybenzoate polyprenyltransferase
MRAIMTDIPRQTGGHTDIRRGDWIDRLLPAALRPYARLARLDRPIGTWLLLLPCWWSIALAAPAGSWPDFWLMALFGIGAVVMRGAGCTINDIIDHKLDAQVERTRVRPIPSGQVSLLQAVLFLGVQCLIGLLILVQLNLFSILLGAASLILVGLYPLMKRVTWWPQAFLGLTFNWGALLGWAAVRGSIDWPALLLYAGGVLWTLGYDTIYAHQDRRDDEQVGIKSTARLFAADSRRWVGGFYAGAFFLWVLALTPLTMGWTVLVPLAATAGLMLVQVRGWDMDDPADSLSTFRAARFTGWTLLIAIVAGVAAMPPASHDGGGNGGMHYNGLPKPYMQHQMLRLADFAPDNRR